MKSRIPVSVFAVTALLILYTILMWFNAPLEITGLLFFISPFLFAWMIISVLKSKTRNVKEFSENEEWGYADKKKEDLTTF